jgi:hypothetical protein
MRTLARSAACTLLLFNLYACATMDAKLPAPEDVRQRIAEAYGFDGFEKITSIQYQMDLEEDGELVTRKWIWTPKTDVVLYQGIASQLYATEYKRKALAQKPSARHSKIDAWFVEDQFWLLFPFHLVWDGQAKVEVVGRKFTPIGWQRALDIRVTYPPAQGTQTPGDVYELFVDDDYRLLQWVHLPTGDPKAAVASTWEGLRRVGPIFVATEHRGKGGKFSRTFSHVSVQLEGSEDWIPAEQPAGVSASSGR